MIKGIDKFVLNKTEKIKYSQELKNPCNLLIYKGFVCVPKAGLEPARRNSPRDFKSLASANSATSANIEVTAGFEPANKGFADLPLSHLGTSPTFQKLVSLTFPALKINLL